MFIRPSEQSEIDGGVGLFLIKLATEKINGKISLAHSSSEGSLFKLSLPKQDIDITNNHHHVNDFAHYFDLN
jgi:sensor histidine kinase regulating citrate/malate metabolism